MKNFHSIKIESASNGITVKAGCLLLVYQQTQLNMFHDDLALYLINPIQAENQIRKRWHIEQAEDEESPDEVEVTPRPESEKTAEKEPG